MFNYLVSNRQCLLTEVQPVKLNGLVADKKYVIKEINMYPNTSSPINSDIVYSGNFLMEVGFNPLVNDRRTSVILEVNEVK